MDTHTIDQTPSEVALHRVLWLIKFLRAMCAPCVARTRRGARVLPGGDRRPLSAGDRHDSCDAGAGHPGSSSRERDRSAAAPATRGLAAVRRRCWPFWSWIYVSITNVRRRALRMQAASDARHLPRDRRREMAGDASSHSRTWTSCLRCWPTFGVAMTVLVVPLSVVVALWVVSRSPERRASSRRSTRGSPPGSGPTATSSSTFRARRCGRCATAAAYALALAGAFLLIASLMYLITAGSTSNKLAALAIVCEHREVMPDCLALSSRWAREIPLVLLLAMAGVKARGPAAIEPRSDWAA